MGVLNIHINNPSFINRFIPYALFINGTKVAKTKKEDVNVIIRAKTTIIFKVQIQPSAFLKRFILSSSKNITIKNNDCISVIVNSREKWWNALLSIDFILFLLFMFLNLPANIANIYNICSDIIFAIWILHFWFKRNCYFDISIKEETQNLLVRHQ